jgi:chitosanase
MLTATQKKTAESIVNLFETSQVLGDYGMVTLIAGDTGHLTFGRSQTTLGSGNLGKLLRLYCDHDGAEFAPLLSRYLPRFDACDTALDHDGALHNLLRASADDPVMRDTQDAFFDEHYWQPAMRAATREDIRSPLGAAVVYDSFVHGAWKAMRDRCNARVGNLAGAGEHRWIEAYVATRRAWLAGHARSDLRPTAYRMDAFQRLIDQSYWNLELPLVVRGQEISTASLAALPPGCYDGPVPGARMLAVQSPILRGLDVRRVQLGLSLRGVDIKADGLFGQTSARCIKAFQAARGLPATGVADVALVAQLCALDDLPV